MLYPQKPVLDIGITNPSRENNGAGRSQLRVGGIPTIDVSRCLWSRSRVLQRWRRAQERGGAPCYRPVHDILDIAGQKVIGRVEGIVRWVPPCGRELIV